MKTTPIFLFFPSCCWAHAAVRRRARAAQRRAGRGGRAGRGENVHLPHRGDLLDRPCRGLQPSTGRVGKARASTANRSFGRPTSRRGKPRSWCACPVPEFGEGITLLGGKLYQLTAAVNTAHVYSLENGETAKDPRLPLSGRRLGPPTDGEKLYMSDGTATIHTVDPATFRRKRVTVTYKGAPVEYLNELEWIGNKNMGQRHTPPTRSSSSTRDGRRRGRRRPRGAAARNGNDRDDRRAERHRL